MLLSKLDAVQKLVILLCPAPKKGVERWAEGQEAPVVFRFLLFCCVRTSLHLLPAVFTIAPRDWWLPTFYTGESWALCLPLGSRNPRVGLDVTGCPSASTAHAVNCDALLSTTDTTPRLYRVFIHYLVLSFLKQNSRGVTSSALGLDV